MTDRASSASGDSDTSSGDESSQPATELMITTRERRTTAGNRYSQLVSQEEIEEDEEDDVALLFAEAEGEDEEYNSDEADDEADMSSSDDDDQGPNAGADELEGEQEIQKQAKVERQKKRKADMALTTISGIRKKPKIDPTSLHRAPDKPKPSKRKERVSWLPDSDAAPGRTSLRKQTVAHREVMLEKLKENEELRLKNKAQREKKERLKQAEAPKALTQADRLAEAARNERRNAKSLNRWEAREKERAEEQAARLAALKHRKLEGAVLTSYSVAHIYHGLQVEPENPGTLGTEEVPVRRKWQRKPKPPIVAQLPSGLLPATPSGQESPSSTSAAVTVQPSIPTQEGTGTKEVNPPAGDQNNGGMLAGIHEYALMKSASGSQDSQLDKAAHIKIHVFDSLAPVSVSVSSKPTEQTTHIDQQESQMQDVTESSRSIYTKPPPAETEVPVARAEAPDLSKASSPGMGSASIPAEIRDVSESQNVRNTIGDETSPLLPSTTQDEAVNTRNAPPPAIEMSIQEQVPKIEVLSSRNLVILERFDELSTNERRNFAVLYNTKKNGKLPKAITEYCAITGQVAKYKDPVSDVGYANLTAYKKLKEAQKHGFRWSSMLGCYVGRVGHVARGVPEGFLGP